MGTGAGVEKRAADSQSKERVRGGLPDTGRNQFHIKLAVETPRLSLAVSDDFDTRSLVLTRPRSAPSAPPSV